MTDTTRQHAITNYIQTDAFARYLGAKVTIIKPGQSRVSLTIADHMTNFHGTTHGSIIFAISDMAFAAACNSHGKIALALNVSISFLNPSYPGDHLVAEATQACLGRRTGLYTVNVYNETTGELIARSQDQAYRKKQWFVPEQ